MRQHPRRPRPPRRHHSPLDAGDYVLLVASLALFASMFLNLWVAGASVNGLEHSAAYVVTMLCLLLAGVILVMYPPLAAELQLPPLPVASPLPLIAIGFAMLLATVYEVGRYTGVDNVAVAPGLALWLALVSTVVYLIGGAIKWGRHLGR